MHEKEKKTPTNKDPQGHLNVYMCKYASVCIVNSISLNLNGQTQAKLKPNSSWTQAELGNNWIVPKTKSDRKTFATIISTDTHGHRIWCVRVQLIKRSK